MIIIIIIIINIIIIIVIIIIIIFIIINIIIIIIIIIFIIIIMFQLLGYTQNVTLQVFVANDTGKVKPHGFYQACRVCGKNSTPCTERDIDGTTVIEMEMLPSEDMTVM